MANQKDNTKYYIAGGTALGLIGLGIGAYYLFRPTDSSSTRRVEFDKDKTQRLLFYTDSSREAWETKPDPWHPKELADRLHTAMKGLSTPQWGETDRSKVWKDVSKLGIHRARWLHNYWLDNRDTEDTIYRWIDAETVLDGTEEGYWWERAKSMLNRSGVGW